MKASELRIGNYVNDRFNAEVTVCDITHGGINLNYGYPTISIDELIPIPLTEEWLLKFDFTRHHADYSNGVIYIKNVPDNTEFEWGVYPNELGSGFQIKNRKLLKYVHQLQNLYFALTGEELILNT